MEIIVYSYVNCWFNDGAIRVCLTTHSSMDVVHNRQCDWQTKETHNLLVQHGCNGGYKSAEFLQTIAGTDFERSYFAGLINHKLAKFLLYSSDVNARHRRLIFSLRPNAYNVHLEVAFYNRKHYAIFVFALIVSICDGLLIVGARASERATSFFKIVCALPMELQETIAKLHGTMPLMLGLDRVFEIVLNYRDI